MAGIQREKMCGEKGKLNKGLGGDIRYCIVYVWYVSGTKDSAEYNQPHLVVNVYFFSISTLQLCTLFYFISYYFIFLLYRVLYSVNTPSHRP